MKQTSLIAHLLTILLVLAGVLLAPAVAQAANTTYFWTATVNAGAGTAMTDGAGSWNTTTKDWQTSSAAAAVVWPGNNSSAFFGYGGTPGLIAVGSATVVGNITFSNVASGYYTFNSGQLRLGAGNAGGVTTIYLYPGVSAEFGTGGSGQVFYDGGAGSGLTCDGGGTLMLSGRSQNSYTGPTTIQGGTTVYFGASLLGSNISTLNLTSGTLGAGASTARTLPNPVNLKGNFTLGAPSTYNGNITFTNAWTLSGGSYTLTVNSISAAINSAIGGSGLGLGFSSTNSGTLTLGYAGTEGYTGPTTINSGTLTLGASCNLNAASGVVIAAGGTFDVSAQSSWSPGNSASPAITASGTATAATIKGGTTVALGSRPITLNWDGTDDTMLTISQGALTMNGNVITINTNNGSTTLAVGPHNIMAVTGGSITLASTPTVLGNAIAPGNQAVVSTSGGTPNYVVVTVSAGAPVVSTPTQSAIGITNATLGATVTSDNGHTITDYGIVWSTSPNPTTTSGNKVQVGTTEALGAFTVGVTGLPAGTVIYYRGYAVNSQGTGYSAGDSFTTLAAEPTAQAAGVSFSAVQGGAATVSWTRGNGSSCIVLVNVGSAVNSDPVDTITYTANANVGSGSQIGTGYVVYSGTGTNVTLLALTPGTTYYVAVYEFNGSGGTQNYLTPATTGSQTTSTGHPVTYYSIAAGSDPTLLSDWWTGNNGTGANPADFLSGDTFIIQSGNNYTITNGGTWTVNATTAGTVATVQINSGGTLTFTLTNNASNLKLGGNLSQAAAGGIAGNGTTATGVIDFTASGSWTGSGDVSAVKLQIYVDSGATLTASEMSSGFKLKSGNTVGFNNLNGTLDLGTNTINGNANASAFFTLGASGTLITANTGALGLPGIFTNFSASKITLPTTANYVFNGSAAQVTGTTANNVTMPATVNNLTFSNSAGVTLSQTTEVDGTLALTAGVVTGNVTLGSSATLSGGGSGAYVNGQLTVPFSTPYLASFTFPVGTATAYSPISLANFTDSGSDTLTASATAAQDPNQASSSIDSTKYIARYWTLTENGGFVSPSYDITGTFVSGDIQGGANTAKLMVQKWDGSSWASPGGYISTSTTVTGTGFTTDFGQFAAGEPASLPVVIATTQSAVTNNAATLGATVFSDSGTAITSYGIVWGTSPSPTTASNKVQAGTSVTTPDTFTVNATGLPAATTIYYRGYATSAAGTAYSTNDSFVTLAKEPTTQASGVSLISVQGGAATISWTRGNGSNCIVLVNAGTPVNSDPVDGVTYTANANLGTGSQIGSGNYVVYLGTNNSVTLSALTPSTIYYVAVYELNGSGGSENYLTPPATGSQTTVAHPVTYYSSTATGDPTQTTSWWTATNGTGANPSDFLGGDTFIIQSGNTYTVAGGGTWTVSGGATIQVNSGGTLYLNVAGSSGTTLQLGGNLIQNGTFGGTGSASGGGTLEFTASGSWTGSGNISANKMGIKVDSGATLTAAGLTTGISFGNAGNNTVSFTVNGTLDMGANTINANGRSNAGFTLNSSGTLITATTSASGLPGLFTGFSSGKIYLASTANYTFNGAAAQVTGTTANNATMPNTVNNLTISNSAGVTLSQATTANGTLTVNTNSTLDLNSLALTAANPPALNGRLKMEVTKSSGSFTGSQLILTSGTLSYGGTLTVTANGDSLAGGDKIGLFTAPAFNTGSSFSTINYPTNTLQAGQSWSAASLTIDGSINITSTGPSGPGYITNSISGSRLTLTWPAGQSWRLVSQTNALSTGLITNSAAWGTVPGVSDGSTTITADPTQPTVFYRLVYP